MRILITAGPTREFLDSVRFLSNASTGRMGYALARAGARRGHDVVLVSGPVELPPPAGVRVVRVTSAGEMLAAARRAFARADVAIFAAAVCDYRPARRAATKRPKRRATWRPALEPTPDIAATLGRRKGRRITIGFALEDHAARAHAAAKLRRKYCDAIVLNHPQAIGSEQTQVDVLTRGGPWQRWPRGSKARVAERLMRFIEKLPRRRVVDPRE
jgi:phosphopantothenoylcysteine decarboxylase/phosphopantothenate--cysteine ligase